MSDIRINLATRNGDTRTLDCVLVDSEPELHRFERALSAHTLVALDTESNSAHSYASRICLMQFAMTRRCWDGSDGELELWLLDPDRVDVRRLVPLFADPNRRFVMHGAQSELGYLHKEFRIRVANLFDTQIAARLASWTSTSIGSILEDQFQVHQSKRVRMSDWGKRPFTASQLTYACGDVAYLVPLYRKLFGCLSDCGRLAEGLAHMEEVASADYSRVGSRDKTFWDHQTTKQVSLKYMGVYKSLWEWREGVAQAWDRPRSRVVTDKVLLSLAHNQPTTRRSLEQCKCLDRRQVRLLGDDILCCIQQGQDQRVAMRPFKSSTTSISDRRELGLFNALRRWRLGKSNERGVDPDIVLSKHSLKAIAAEAPMSVAALAGYHILPDWKLEQYGQEVVEIVQGFSQVSG